ncbi:MAG: hypothetical protein L6R39_006463, partial [Caloplaca ligustica]
MYLVLLAGSLPGLRPIFNKRMRTSSSSYQHSSYAHDHPPSSAPHNKNNNANKKHMVLKLSSLPSNNRSKVYASTGNHNRNDEDGDSTENILNGMGYRDTVKMAE